MCRLDDAIEKLENGSEIQDVIDAIEVLALEMTDLKEIYYAGTPLLTRS
jgi:FtsZ-binding cell division protein ZapB